MQKNFKIALLLVVINSSIFAAGNTNTGCGLGSMLIPNQDTVATQILAVTSNGVGSQTFAITSGSLNCTKPYKIAMNDRAQMFVAENMDSIAIDIASGEGESLETLLSLMDVADKKEACLKLKANFARIYTSADVTSAQVVDRMVLAL